MTVHTELLISCWALGIFDAILFGYLFFQNIGRKS
jgi:nicotinamide riboside transporter PnuC